VDIDHFKVYNDEHGHLAGDEVLRVFGRTITATARRSDLVARMGGEEFVIAMPDTDAEGARRLAERARSALEGGVWPRKPLTASFGVATITPDDADTANVGSIVSALLSAADAALYHSKRSGRNRTTHAADLPTSS
jgi:diguanylate cyclase (GGDEF)-like protein